MAATARALAVAATVAPCRPHSRVRYARSRVAAGGRTPVHLDHRHSLVAQVAAGERGEAEVDGLDA